jgi:hypothetical protein
VFSECADVCGSCGDHARKDDYCDTEECVAGCTCPAGQVMDREGNCVIPSQCKCYDPYDSENPYKNEGDEASQGCSKW